MFKFKFGIIVTCDIHFHLPLTYRVKRHRHVSDVMSVSVIDLTDGQCTHMSLDGVACHMFVRRPFPLSGQRNSTLVCSLLVFVAAFDRIMTPVDNSPPAACRYAIQRVG